MTGPDPGSLPSRQAHVLALSSLPRMGPARLGAMLSGHHPAEVWAAVCAGTPPIDARRSRAGSKHGEMVEAWRIAAATIDPARLLHQHRRAGVEVLVRDDAGFPDVLACDPEPPSLLTVLGQLDPSFPTVALVGTRRSTGYGRDVALRLGRELAEAGVSVVSGLAAGIDAAAHRGAIAAAGAPPIGVVATGLDVVYPRRHRVLWHQVASEGALISESPLGTTPARWRFPARNRMIAALADAVVVVESHLRGGSLHTVTSAVERDVEVLAVPGPVTSPASVGTNALLAAGVGPARHVDDVLVAIGRGGHRIPPAAGSPDEDGRVPRELRSVLDALDVTPTSVDTVAVRTGRELVGLHADLRRLREHGLVAEEAGWWWRVDPCRVSPR